MQAAGLNEVPLGGLSSYSLLLMLLAHLQIEGWKPISSAAFSIEQAKAATCAAPAGAAAPAEVTAGPAGPAAPQQQPAVAPAVQPAAQAASKAASKGASQPVKPASARTASSPAAQPAAKSASQPRSDVAQAGEASLGEASPAKAEHDAFGPGELSPEPEVGGLPDFVPLASVSPSAAGAAAEKSAQKSAQITPKGSTAAGQTVGKTVGTDAVEAEVPVSKAGAAAKPGFAQGLASIGAALKAQAAARKQPAGQPGAKTALDKPAAMLDSKDAAGPGPDTPAVAQVDPAAAAPASDEKPVVLSAAMAAQDDAQVSHTVLSESSIVHALGPLDASLCAFSHRPVPVIHVIALRLQPLTLAWYAADQSCLCSMPAGAIICGVHTLCQPIMLLVTLHVT